MGRIPLYASDVGSRGDGRAGLREEASKILCCAEVFGLRPFWSGGEGGWFGGVGGAVGGRVRLRIAASG